MFPEDSPKRFDRIIAIMTQLQSKKIVKAQELADRFQVSLRTIYRDIRSLEASGVPIYGEAGVGYSLVDGYKLPPVMFSREEAESFIAAEKLMEKFTDEIMKTNFKSAVLKVKSVLRGEEKDWLESIENRVQISNRNQSIPENSPQVLNTLFESIARKIQLELTYQSVESEIPSIRFIEPVGIYYENNFWYILAYCHLRNDYRNFRVDRILDLSKTNFSFTKEHQELDFYLKKEPPKNEDIVRLRVHRKVANYLHNDRNYYGFISEEKKGDVVDLTFKGNYRETGIARWILMFGDYCEILEPKELKEYTLELLENIKTKLK